MANRENNSKLYTWLVILGGIFIAGLMLMGFFNWLDARGLPTGLIAFLVVIAGIFSLSSAGTGNSAASVFIVFIGLFLFADSIGLFGSDRAPWLWPLFNIVFSILVLIYKFAPKNQAAT